MSTEITAELRGLLRGALAAVEKARAMAAEVNRPITGAALMRTGHTLLSLIGRLDTAEEVMPAAEIKAAAGGQS